MYTLQSLKPVQHFVFPATVTFSSFVHKVYCTVISVYDDTNTKKTAKNTLLKI